MLLPRRRITFTSATTGTVIAYDYACSIEIIRSIDALTDTATITIPRKLVYKSGKPLTPQNQNEFADYVALPAFNNNEGKAYVVGADALFKRGDNVKIEIGYGENLQTRFAGCITKVTSTIPITITCEDYMWYLKQGKLNFPDDASYKLQTKIKGSYDPDKLTYTLKELLDGILPTAPKKIFFSTADDNFDLGNVTYEDLSIAKILENLKDTHGLYSYFKDDATLYVGFYTDLITRNVQEFEMEKVVIEDDSLEWQDASDVPTKVRGIATKDDGTKKIYEAHFLNEDIQGSFVNEASLKNKFEGDVVTKNTKSQNDKSLKKMVEKFLPTCTYTGFKGDIKTIGEPFVNRGDVCKLTSTAAPERNGYYLITEVKINDDKDGYFQTLKLGIKLYKK